MGAGQRVYGSPLIEEGRRAAVRRAILAYFAADYLVCAHLLVPQIEHAFRKILEVLGVSTFRPGRHGGLALKTLADVIREPILTQIFGEDFIQYSAMLLVDQRGWNIRNDICHGIAEPASISAIACDRLLHVLLVLGMTRANQDPGQRGTTAS